MLIMFNLTSRVINLGSMRNVAVNENVFTRGIKHDFPYINICYVPREVLKTNGASRGTLQRLMNDKIMFDRYYCINLTKHCENEENIGGLYFITSSHFPTR